MCPCESRSILVGRGVSLWEGHVFVGRCISLCGGCLLVIVEVSLWEWACPFGREYVLVGGGVSFRRHDFDAGVSLQE